MTSAGHVDRQDTCDRPGLLNHCINVLGPASLPEDVRPPGGLPRKQDHLPYLSEAEEAGF